MPMSFTDKTMLATHSYPQLPSPKPFDHTPLERLAVMAERMEDAAGEHGYRVGRLTALLAEAIDCSKEYVQQVEFAARMHDIGKMVMPSALWLSPYKLQKDDLQKVRQHPQAGLTFLVGDDAPEMVLAREVVRYHHERWDGTGYPDKLAGEAIPLAARLTSLAEVFDALTHSRPRRGPWTIEATLDEIRRGAGSQFDPKLVEHFIALIERLRAEQPDLDAYLGPPTWYREDTKPAEGDPEELERAIAETTAQRAVVQFREQFLAPRYNLLSDELKKPGSDQGGG